MLRFASSGSFVFSLQANVSQNHRSILGAMVPISPGTPSQKLHHQQQQRSNLANSQSIPINNAAIAATNVTSSVTTTTAAIPISTTANAQQQQHHHHNMPSVQSASSPTSPVTPDKCNLIVCVSKYFSFDIFTLMFSYQIVCDDTTANIIAYGRRYVIN